MGRQIPTETLLQVLRDQRIPTFSNKDFQQQFRFSRTTAQARLWDLVRRGVLRRFLHGWYVVRGPVEAEVLREPMFLGTHLVEPSYVAFGSALRFHGWTERGPRATYIASPRRSRLPRAAGHPVYFVRMPPFQFFGYAMARRGSLEFPVADPEKAIVDAFDRPRHCGGIKSVIAALEKARPALDLGRLEAYTLRMSGRSLCSRLGYVLEGLGETPGSLQRHLSAVPVKLDSRGSRRGRVNRRWQVIDNL